MHFPVLNIAGNFLRTLLGISVLAGVFLGCGSTTVTTGLTAEERFQRAKALFDQEDYLEAIQEFNVITLQHPGPGESPCNQQSRYGPTYEEMTVGQIETAKRQRGEGDLRALFTAGDTWTVA